METMFKVLVEHVSKSDKKLDELIASQNALRNSEQPSQVRSGKA